MLAENGDILQRESEIYEVICADKKVFVIAPRSTEGRTDYLCLEAYSNCETVNTLQELKFTKI